MFLSINPVEISKKKAKSQIWDIVNTNKLDNIYHQKQKIGNVMKLQNELGNEDMITTHL